MATLGRSLYRLRTHHPERVVLTVALAVAALYLVLHQELLWELNLVFSS